MDVDLEERKQFVEDEYKQGLITEEIKKEKMMVLGFVESGVKDVKKGEITVEEAEDIIMMKINMEIMLRDLKEGRC